ncbi:MAG TPA: ice-binding family protein, partial [Rhodothermales bacterium]|nr:ice-binding family protein [Rhodothermales bacterium]
MKSTVTNPQVITRPKTFLSLLAGAAVLILMIRGDALAQTFIDLGNAASFGVLGAETVTNGGDTIVDGDVGVHPGPDVVGFPPGIVLAPYTIYETTTEAANAQTDLTTAYNNADGQTSTSSVTELSGLTLVPGVYTSAATMSLTAGNLTLDAQDDPNAVWIFQAGSDLIVGSSTQVILSNGAQAGNVFWQVSSSATIGTSASFNGTI